jgi:flagellar biosynthesis component FlhA
LNQAQDHLAMTRKQLEDSQREIQNKEEIINDLRMGLMNSVGSAVKADEQNMSVIQSKIQEELEKTKTQVRQYEAEIASRMSQSGTPFSGRVREIRPRERSEGDTFDLLSEFNQHMQP